MTYHIIIQQERRISTEDEPRQLAQPISQAIPTGNTIDGKPEYIAGPAQLHTITSANLSILEDDVLTHDFSDPQFVMVVEWDLHSPYVIQHKGDYSKRTLSYAGWPSLTKEQYDAANPVAL